MATVSLTPQQQAQVDAANAILASAQSSFDSAINNYNAAKNDFCNNGWWNYLTNCDVKNAESKALVGTLAVLGGPVAVAIHNWTQKKWQKPSSCQEAIDKGILLKWDCDRGTGDCISVKGCNDRVGQYNGKLSAIYSAANVVEGEKSKLNSAKDNLNTILDSIAKDPTHAINEGLAQDEIEAKKSKDNIKWMFFGLAAVIIVGTAIFIGMRMLKGGASS